MPRTLPAEWAPQSGVMLTWPHPHGDWRPWLDQVEAVFIAIAATVSAHEGLLITAYDTGHQRHIQAALVQQGINPERIRFHIQPSNDTWVRDHGPITVHEAGQLRLLDYTFNGWGGKFEATLDNRLTSGQHSAGLFGSLPLEPQAMVLEGGSIDSDGQGTLMTTRRCLQTPTRNPDMDQPALETHLHQAMGAQRVLWLDHGTLAGDDTDGHIDTLARFCDPGTIAYVHCDDPSDAHYCELQHMEAELQRFTQADGRPYRLVPLPWPRAHCDAQGRRLPATYANFLIINEAVLVPSYADPADARAREILQDCFPGRVVIGIDCQALIVQNGSLHCVTMQLPAGVLSGA